MLALVRWLSVTSASAALRDADWLVPLLQSIHILSIAMLTSSMLMIGLRVLRPPGAHAQSLADTTRRFAPWLWSGLALLAVSGLPLIVAEPQRTLPNASFQVKLVLLALAAATTFALLASLRRGAQFAQGAATASPRARLLAAGALLLWCAVAAAGRFIAYTQPL